MAASLSVNAMQVDFVSVLAMEHISMVWMFKTLEETWLKGFLEVSNSVYEGIVVEFFANAKFFAGTIVTFIANKKMVLTKDMFAEAFGLPTEDCDSLRQSGPRPDPRLLRQAALEALTRSARTNTPRKTGPEQFPAKLVGGGGGAWGSDGGGGS
ncbi:hypothetical protein F511_38067 [Dorcoceras hygrometricum]|uniref:Uncharacterized protein n=1 Tax=Dorcoceras hygrometricum TaxID=472368 RepID=A0A2Z7CFI5_9LAMI|nr:hypothetical protein F511_38067 [Dorcoceras hygrometricum]